MPKKSSSDVVINNEWELQDVPTRGARRGVTAAKRDAFIEGLTQAGRLEVHQTIQASARVQRTAEALPPLDITLPADPAAVYLLALRHPSGALTFHRPSETPVRRGAAGEAIVRFQVEFPQEEREEIAAARRSILSSVIKGTVLKVSGKLADHFLPRLVRWFEESHWRKKGLREGWLQVTPEALRTNKFKDADFSLIESHTDRSLLLLHGTFSNAAGAYRDLAVKQGSSGANFFSALRPIYGDRMFAFNHFSLSKTPEQNARELLNGLPKPATFDVITHSRGGLVLRELVERKSALGKGAEKFHLRHAILVASPNQGTPLATPDRWETCVGWTANLADMFPENPFTLTLEFVSEALVWLAHRASDGIPGIGAMNAVSDLIKALEKTAPPVQGSYSALVSNYLPDSTLLARMADAGLDTFFRGACDLVVPTEGGWKVGTAPTVITPSEIACFNLSNGGNIKSDLNVVHTQFFGQPQTIDFLVETLSGTAHALPVLDPSLRLPSRGLRAAGPTMPETARTLPPKPEPAAPEVPQVMTPSGLLPRRAAVPTAGLEADEVFHLFIMSPDEPNPLEHGEQKPRTRTSKSRKQTAKPKTSVALLLATFRNARVVESVVLPPEDLDPIKRFNDDIKDYINGKPGAPNLPGQEKLKKFGVELFKAIFPPGVRRLYDVARSEVSTRGHRLSIVMTSMINSVADKPWEFAYDPSRQTFLAPEDVNFTRNVLTGVPSDVESKPHGPMHILIVVAQPVGLRLLSEKEEETMVLRGFRHLMDAKMADVQVLRNATADLLHQTLELSEYDVIHFIGHGEYVEDEQEGYLIFESADGRAQPVSAESMRQILCHRNLRLVFLNACETGMVGRSNATFDFNRGLAPKLVSGGIPAVVANQYKVLDLSATEFARRFYWSLAQGKSVGDAAREARVAVNYSIAGECIDWAVPVVYARNPCHSLFRPIQTAPAPQEVPAGAPERRAAATEKKRIGLWDVNHVLPSLEKVAEKLSNAQSMYSFEVIDITAPLGTWRLIQDKNQATQPGVIHGQEVCEKLRGQVNGLGLSRLFCITTFAVADTFGKKYIKDLAMWNDDTQQKITIISGAGNLFQEQSKNPDYPVARFISNCIANALCGKIEHQKAPTNCPNFFREKHRTMQERLEYTTGHQHLCAACQKKLGNKALSDVVQQILGEF